MKISNIGPVQGVKYDEAKADWDLVPVGVLPKIITVLQFGAQKYAPDNWMRVPNGRKRYYNALMRHMEAWRAGEKKDPESGLSHLAHAGCCMFFLLWLEDQPQE